MPWFFRRKRTAEATSADAADQRRLFGRRYTAGIPYMLPTDMQEVNRLDFQHYMIRYVLKGNYVAPIGAPTSILDAGTGTGRWAVEMAAQFPRASVVGVDAVTPQADAARAADASQDELPEQERRPANYRFVAANLLEGLPFDDGSFDFVHQRLLYSAIPAPRWPGEVRELARVTRPGGWVELVEGSLGSTQGDVGPAMRQLFDWAVAVTGKREIDLGIGTHLHTFLREAGLASVTQREIALPIGTRGGRLGTMVEADLVSVTTGLRAPIIAVGLTDGETFDKTLAAWRAEMQRYSYSWPIYVAYGQRPR